MKKKIFIAVFITVYSAIFSQSQLTTPEGFVFIQGGTFIMGSPENEPQRHERERQWQVTVSDFYLGKYEVTQAEYEAVMGNNPSRFSGYNLPVEQVSWYDAIEYCNRLSQRDGLMPVYTLTRSNHSDYFDVKWNRNVNGYRLPTEAEWEYACRAGTTTPFNTGNNITTDQANYRGDRPYNNNDIGEYRQATTPVGSFSPNQWGLFDMHGNVSEWCWDWWISSYPREAQIDPIGPESVFSSHVIRGGDWGAIGRNLRSAARSASDAPDDRGDFIGFRLARSIINNTTISIIKDSSITPTHLTKANLHLRESANTTSNIVTTLQKDTEVQIIETGANATIDGITASWVKVVSSTSFTGWCFSGYLEEVNRPGSAELVYNNENDDPVKAGKSPLPMWLWIAIATGAVAIAGGVVLVVIKRKK